MLVLSRKPGQEVVIGDDIRVTVIAIHGNQVRLGFTAPAGISLRRLELVQPADPSRSRESQAMTPRAKR